jgi:phosphoribosyl-AMP cyclohydrolase
VDRVDQIIERAADRLRELEESAVAVVVTGSHARGTADEHSDLDVRAITHREPHIHYRIWFAERPGRKPLHVSLGAHSLAYWLAARREPAYWTLGFPTVYHATYVWATAEARAALGADPSIVRPAAPPQLEAFIEWATKVQRARSHADPVGARFYARKLAESIPGLLLGFNEQVVVHSAREAVDAAVSLPVAPEHYRDDFPVCLGLTAANVDEVERAALRLTHEILAFLRERKPDFDPQPDIARYLADGTLERHLGFRSR